MREMLKSDYPVETVVWKLLIWFNLLNSGDEDTVEEEAEAEGRPVRQGPAQEEGPGRRRQEDIRESSSQGRG